MTVHFNSDGSEKPCAIIWVRCRRNHEAIHSFLLRDGLLRGACHRARVRATRWLAMTAAAGLCWKLPSEDAQKYAISIKKQGCVCRPQR